MQRARRQIRRQSGCLSALGSREHRFLAAFAGIGGRTPMSEAAAARRVGVPARHAGHFRKQAMRDLAGARRAGRCGSATGSSVPALSGGHGARMVDLALPAGANRTDFASGVSNAGSGANGRTGESRSGGTGHGAVAGVTRSGRTLADAVEGNPWSDPLLAAVGLAFLLGLGALVVSGRRPHSIGGPNVPTRQLPPPERPPTWPTEPGEPYSRIAALPPAAKPPAPPALPAVRPAPTPTTRPPRRRRRVPAVVGVAVMGIGGLLRLLRRR